MDDVTDFRSFQPQHLPSPHSLSNPTSPHSLSNLPSPHSLSTTPSPHTLSNPYSPHSLSNTLPEARQLVEAKMPTVISGGTTYAAAASSRRDSRSGQCQTSLTWVFSDRPLRKTESNLRSSGGPGSVSTGTQASSGKSRTV